MSENYTDPQGVLNKMLPIFQQCSKQNNSIDGIAFSLNSSILAQSTEKFFDDTVIPSLLANLSETTKDTYNEDTTLQYICFQMKDSDNQRWAWTVVYLDPPYESYSFVFVGQLEEKNYKARLTTHQSTVPLYLKKLLPFVEEYHRLTA